MCGSFRAGRGFAECDPGLKVCEEPGGDLGVGGAVVGLGGEVTGTMANEPGRDSEGAGELEAGLEVPGTMTNRGPGLVDDLDRPAICVAVQHGREPRGCGGMTNGSASRSL